MVPELTAAALVPGGAAPPLGVLRSPLIGNCPKLLFPGGKSSDRAPPAVASDRPHVCNERCSQG